MCRIVSAQVMKFGDIERIIAAVAIRVVFRFNRSGTNGPEN